MCCRLIISNDSSGRSTEKETVAGIFPSDSTRWIALDRETNLVAAIEDAVVAGCEVVIAAGGDGTVNAVVNALMRLDIQSRPKLAILPMGTANDFAATLNIPDNLVAACHLIETGCEANIDVVRIRSQNFERYFANVAAGGNSVRVTEEMTPEMKTRWGAFCYLRGGLSVLADLKSFRVDVQCDDESFNQLDCWAILIANGRTNAGRIVVAPQASPTDGLLDVIIIRDGGILDIFEIVSTAVLGNFLECEQVLFRQVKKVSLYSHPEMRFTLDGEIVDEEPIEFEVMPQAIQTFVGPEFCLDNK